MLLLQEQMKFVDVVAGALALSPISGDTSPDLVLDNEHTKFLQLFAQFLDIKADQTILDIHVSSVVKDIEGAGDINLQSGGDEPGFFFRLLQKNSVQVTKDRDINRPWIIEIRLVD